MVKQSAGLLMYRKRGQSIQVLLVHPGGPFWAKKDLGAWSIPKGEFAEDEDALKAARREFEEETGFLPTGNFIRLGSIKQPSGKIVHAWGFEGDLDTRNIKSNTFLLEWPPQSGKQQEFPEVDRADWFNIETAKEKITKGQIDFLDELLRNLESDPPEAA
ncbi:MAG TPA: NUDIX domain-containing protein [Syntrophorhabdales bacterium]|nr:NUDIX domain-containing protein [Syntrophorhabdales bacterium]